jgi:hypothetical protein
MRVFTHYKSKEGCCPSDLQPNSTDEGSRYLTEVLRFPDTYPWHGVSFYNYYCLGLSGCHNIAEYC